MISRTVYIGNPAKLSVKNEQLVVHRGDDDPRGLPIEDLGLVILDHGQITVSATCLQYLTQSGVAVLVCGSSHLPLGLLLPLEDHHIHAQRLRAQVSAPKPRQKQLWQRLIQAKLRNQGALLEAIHGEGSGTALVKWAREVRSGDPNNLEARGAAVYWRRIFPSLPDFSRGREGPPPNHLLNYGYAILRAMVARALVGTGLHPALGIHHINQYNPFALADDCMEPFRPWVDARAYDLWLSLGEDLPPELTPELKKQMLPLTQDDVAIDGKRRPLQNAIQLFAASFAQALSKPKSSNLLLPDMEQTLGWRLLPEPPEMDESDVGLTPA